MSAKKKIIISLISVLVAVGLIFTGIYALNSSSKADETDLFTAEAFVNEEFDKIASSQISKLIAEKNTIKVDEISYGSQKDIILECRIKTVDLHTLLSPHYDEFLGTSPRKSTGMYKSKSDLNREFREKLTTLISDCDTVEKKATLTLYQTDSGLKVYADKKTADFIYGGVDKIREEVLDKTHYTDSDGVKKEIGSTNITRGLVECFKLRYDDRIPDTGSRIVRMYNSFKYDFHRIFIEHARWKSIFTGLWVTLKLTFFALIIGIFLGFLVAFIRCTAIKLKKKNFLLSLLDLICKLYISIIRGTPAMVQIMIIYFVFFMPMGVSKFIAAVVCFGLNSGAYVAEIVRGGIMSVDEGQTEAGRSLGFGYMSTMFYIILPQAFKAVLPALANEFIVLLKETSIAFYIGLGDLMYSVNAIRAATYTQFMPLIAAALIYLVLVLVLSKLVSILERRLRNNER